MMPEARPPDTGPNSAAMPPSVMPPDQYAQGAMDPFSGIQEEGLFHEEGIDDSPRRKNRGKIWVSALLAFIAVLFVLRYQVFTITHVRVSGNRNIPWQTVAQAAGLDRGLFYFTVNEDEIRDGINAHRYLIYRGMEKIPPNTLALTVTERQPAAFFTHLGIGFVIASDGMILEKTSSLDAGGELIAVSGLAFWGQLTPGMMPATTDGSQVEMLVLLLKELDNWAFAGEISSIDIAQDLNLSLVTKDGFTVNLGSAENLHAKVGTVQAVVMELRRRQMTGGMIGATVPGEASYRPPLP